MHPGYMSATRDSAQSPVPLLPHSTAGHLGRQHCFPCSSPAQSLCLHFTGGGNSNLKKPALYPSCKFHFWHLFLPPPGRAGQWSLAAAAALSRRLQRTPGPGPEPKGTACTGSLRGSAPPASAPGIAQHTGQLQLGAVLPRAAALQHSHLPDVSSHSSHS